MDNAEEHIKKEIKRSNRILNFDRRSWHRRDVAGVSTVNHLDLALNMIQSENYEYLRGIKASIKDKNLRVAGSLLRSLLESTANAHWLTQDKTGKRATRYIKSTEQFTEYVNKTGNKTTFTIDKLSREASTWTTSSAEDRINFFSPQAGVVWDYCSIFTHASPSYLALHQGLNKVLTYVIAQANTYALTARLIIKESSSIYNVNEKKFLDKIAREVLKDLGMI